MIWVPGEGSNTGNETGGRKFARYHFVARHTSERGAPFTTAGFARVLERVGKVAKLAFKLTRTCSGTQLRMRAKSGVL